MLRLRRIASAIYSTPPQCDPAELAYFIGNGFPGNEMPGRAVCSSAGLNMELNMESGVLFQIFRENFDDLPGIGPVPMAEFAAGHFF